MEQTEILQKVNGIPWFHSFELLPGITTPGRVACNPRYTFDHRYQLPANLSGLKALDIGTWDGPYAFELERRGAEVVALDIQDPSATGFNAAKEILRSNVKYIRASVYDLSKVLSTKFDIVCFFGVYYHLKCPVLAFEELHKILKAGGLLLIEGECLRNWAPTPVEAAGMDNVVLAEGAPGVTCPAQEKPHHPKSALASIIEKCRALFAASHPARLARSMAESNVPIALFYAGQYKQDSTNWFVPNLACIREWLSEAGLQLVSYGFDDQKIPCQRFWGSAKKVPGSEIPIEHGLVKRVQPS